MIVKTIIEGDVTVFDLWLDDPDKMPKGVLATLLMRLHVEDGECQLYAFYNGCMNENSATEVENVQCDLESLMLLFRAIEKSGIAFHLNYQNPPSTP